MEIVCIKSSKLAEGSPPAPLVHKGCRYNITNVMEKEYFWGMSGIFYELLETGVDVYHHHTLFAVAPPIVDEIEKEKELVLIPKSENHEKR